MVLQYSNQETSVTIGESVRDEDGNIFPLDLRKLLFLSFIMPAILGIAGVICFDCLQTTFDERWR